mmetsp:Transcript_104904/g.292162  ORF Transcript_104904/g.292162 Transcript_104904/m.292162 type:complete len:237 (-) Transcript_104904:563-1273(-)
MGFTFFVAFLAGLVSELRLGVQRLRFRLGLGPGLGLVSVFSALSLLVMTFLLVLLLVVLTPVEPLIGDKASGEVDLGQDVFVILTGCKDRSSVLLGDLPPVVAILIHAPASTSQAATPAVQDAARLTPAVLKQVVAPLFQALLQGGLGLLDELDVLGVRDVVLLPPQQHVHAGENPASLALLRVPHGPAQVAHLELACSVDDHLELILQAPPPNTLQQLQLQRVKCLATLRADHHL